MEYSPMMVVMLWALTPSGESGSVPALVEEMQPPGMTVHQESYFTFNHGKPFVAEQDPVTGAILNLKTTPVVQEDYLYDEDEEAADGIDRKDSKVYTRNDIVQPSKDPDLHKFLNLPVHYSSSGKFPLISSSYANMKVQGHNAAAHSNHRPAPTTSTSTVSPSYYPLKTSTDTPAPLTSSSTPRSPTTETSTTPRTGRTTTRPTTPRPVSTTTTKPPPPPPSAYEYEYEYDYDREPEPQHKQSTTQSSILDFFGKDDYEFLGASEEEKNSTKVDYVLPSASAPVEHNKGDKEMISPHSDLFIPSDYLKPNTTSNAQVNSTVPVKNENKTETVYASTPDTYKPVTEKVTSIPVKEIVDESPFKENASATDNKHDEDHIIGMKLTSTVPVETTTPKIETTSKPPYKEQKVPFFPTVLPDEKENIYIISSKPNEEKMNNDKVQPKPSQTVPQDIKPTQNASTSSVKPLEFHHPYLKPQDVYVLQNKPSESVKPYNPYQRPPYVNSNFPLEMQPPQRPAEPSYYPRPPPEAYMPIDNPYSIPNRGQNRPYEAGTVLNKPPGQHDQYRPQHEIRPVDSKPASTEKVSQDLNRPAEGKPHESKPRPEQNVPMSKPTATGFIARPTDSTHVFHNRPHEGMQYRPVGQQGIQSETGLHSRPHEHQKPIGRPTDPRYPPYKTIRPQEVKPEQRPPTPEYRPLPPRPQDTRPQGVQEFSVGLGSKVPEFNKNKPDTSTINNNKFQVQFTQPSKVENHFIKVSPGQENPSYSLQTSFSIGVPPPDEVKGTITSANSGPSGTKGVGQVLFPDDVEKRPSPPAWAEEESRPAQALQPAEGDKYPRPPWESHLKPPLVYNHVKKEPYPFKRPKPSRPDLPNILPQFRPNAKIGHAEPHVYLKTPYDTLRPPPLPRPQFLRAEPPVPEEEKPVHRRNGQTTRVVPIPIQPIVQAPPKRGTLRSDDEKTHPVFVVYPSNNAQDGVVVGTRGSQRPLPPDNLDIVEDAFPLDTNKNFQSRVDTPILKGKPTKPAIKNEFPYPLVKPTEAVEDKTVKQEKVTEKVTKEYTAFSPTVSPTEKEHDTEINVIPYLQDYMPFATKKPSPDSPTWKVGEDIKPISVTLKTQKNEETTSKVENHKSGDLPTPQDFQAPFHASLSAPSQGWSVVRPRTESEKEGETTTEKSVEEQDGKFDIQNFKPQLFGGFQPIIPPVDESGETKPIKSEKEASQ